ncbi:MAG: DUF5004 domain-containing protein [Flavisolibacter sp.]
MKPFGSLLQALVIICLSLLMGSCYKITTEANALPQGFSVSQVIGTWKVEGLSSDKPYDWDGNGTAETDVYSTWSACEKDNLYTFNSDYSGNYRFSCSSTKLGAWRLDGTVTLVWIASGSPETYEKIVYLTSDTMKTQITIKQSNGQTYSLTKVWKLQ